MSTATDTKVKDALDHVRASAQELDGAISDAVAKHNAATKGDLEALAQKTKTVTESVKSSLSVQHDTDKKNLTEAAAHLDATQKHINEAMKTSGKAVEDSIAKALAEARASVEKVSEAVAARRAADSAKKAK